MNIDIGACLSFGFERVKNNPLYYIVGLLMIGLGGGLSFQILTGPLIVGYMRGMMKEDQGRPAELGDVFSGLSDFVPSLVAHLLAAVMIAIGFMLCIIPGLLVAPIGYLAYYAVAAGEKDGLNAIKRGWAILMTNMVGLALAAFVFGLVAGLGVLLCGVGVLFTAPVAVVALYRMAQIAHASAAPAPSFGPPGAMPPGGYPPGPMPPGGPGGFPPQGPPR